MREGSLDALRKFRLAGVEMDSEVETALRLGLVDGNLASWRFPIAMDNAFRHKSVSTISIVMVEFIKILSTLHHPFNSP